MNQFKRKKAMRLHSLIFLAAMAASIPTLAHDARIGAIHVMHPAAPASLPGQSTGVAYLSLENEGTAPDRLLSLTSPAAGSVAIHSMQLDGGIMKMRELDTLALPPAAKVSMKAGSGYHVMLMGLKQPMKTGDKIPLFMTFERAGKLEVSIHVGPSAADKAGEMAVEKPAEGLAPHRH